VRLYLIRHADPDYANHTITPTGHREARALADRLADEKLDRIYVSPLGRARDTMQYTIDRTGLPYQVEDWLQEIGGRSGESEELGKIAAWNVPGQVVRADRSLPTSANWSSRPPLDNPAFSQIYAGLRASSDAFLARHGYAREGGAYRMVACSSERIALFCHAGFGLTWLAPMLDLPLPLVWTGFFLAPSSVTIVLLEERSAEFAAPRCLCVGDTSHLHAAGLPVTPSGIVANFD
jgi:histidine phosphatase superfamily protein (branch 1)